MNETKNQVIEIILTNEMKVMTNISQGTESVLPILLLVRRKKEPKSNLLLKQFTMGY